MDKEGNKQDGKSMLHGTTKGKEHVEKNRFGSKIKKKKVV